MTVLCRLYEDKPSWAAAATILIPAREPNGSSATYDRSSRPRGSPRPGSLRRAGRPSWTPESPEYRFGDERKRCSSAQRRDVGADPLGRPEGPTQTFRPPLGTAPAPASTAFRIRAVSAAPWTARPDLLAEHLSDLWLKSVDNLLVTGPRMLYSRNSAIAVRHRSRDAHRAPARLRRAGQPVGRSDEGADVPVVSAPPSTRHVTRNRAPIDASSRVLGSTTSPLHTGRSGRSRSGPVLVRDV